MGALKSQFGLVACAVYSVVTAIALVRDLTRKPGLLILIDDPIFSTILTLPGVILIAVPLELLGVKGLEEPPYRTPFLVASAVLTAALAYLLGAGAEALYKAWVT